ncbi:uncharacterized protein N7446_007910 [Penicillium canescens]|uniref:Uncharacterized protein n=1 Tax=Penicillium canescens TaxID=5083 RepID=A0AAD6NDZ7_PENCN|nr:uncharacterized protein N7446_007910 [Penicillium canescens]KAJ6033799.1 hypothetical protein N7444_011570 [Penicillium canescens]KAJ6057011.1 hypothetical protein N7460_000285 [Penicillium canescens]KAJ6058327.1 hypothetical protein N7446_007910 [Penicillium canescens]
MECSSEDERSSSSKVPLKDHLATIQRPATSDALAKKYHQEFLSRQDPVFLNAAIRCARWTVNICPPDNSRAPRYCVRVATYLESRDRRFKSPYNNDLIEALEYLDLASYSTHVGSEAAREKAQRLQIALLCHQRLYLNGDDITDFEHVVGIMQDAAAAWEIVDDKNKISLVYFDLAHMYNIQSKTCEEKGEGGNLSLLDRAVECIEKAVEAILVRNERWVDYNEKKIDYLMLRAKHNKATAEDDYRAAIDTCRMLMDDCDESENFSQNIKAHFQCFMGRLYYFLATVTDENDDLHQATYNLQRASEDTPREDPEWEDRFEMFHDVLEAYTVKLGKPIRHNSLIRTQREKVRELLESEKEEDQGEPQAEALYTLSVLHQHRYISRHAEEDLIITTERLQEAVAKTSESDYTNLLQRLGLAADCYHVLYGDEGDPKYLRMGVKTGERAVEVVNRARNSVGSRKKGGIYYTLGRCLAELAKEENDDELMQRAVRAGESAVELLEEGDDDEEDEDGRRKQYHKYLSCLEMWRESL